MELVVPLGDAKLVFHAGKYEVVLAKGEAKLIEEKDELIPLVTAMCFEKKAAELMKDSTLEQLFLTFLNEGQQVNVYDVSSFVANTKDLLNVKDVLAWQFGLQDSKQRNIGLNVVKLINLPESKYKQNIFACIIFHELGHCCDPEGLLDSTVDDIVLKLSGYSTDPDLEGIFHTIASYQGGDPKVEALSTLVEAYALSRLVMNDLCPGVVDDIKGKLEKAHGKLIERSVNK
jgi:hypothetical protein